MPLVESQKSSKQDLFKESKKDSHKFIAISQRVYSNKRYFNRGIYP